MRQLKVAVTGAHGTGKTTLTTAVVERLKHEFEIAHTAEVPRLFIEEVSDPTFFQRGNNSFSRQTMLIARQIELEANMLRKGMTVLVCDRTVLDHWAYTETLFPDSSSTIEGRAWKAIVGRWLESYDAIYRLPIELTVELDGVREADTEFQHNIDRKIDALYREFGYDVGTISGSLETRQKTLIASIREAVSAAST
jgi:nicotinamide riboside kinase